ncbi:hypothetical protein HDU96_003308 [Phlyctochytrium bullatum]|nr:hypothetical protein HDU96_003308 [Phlyctochytrium bullatum]
MFKCRSPAPDADPFTAAAAAAAAEAAESARKEKREGGAMLGPYAPRSHKTPPTGINKKLDEIAKVMSGHEVMNNFGRQRGTRAETGNGGEQRPFGNPPVETETLPIYAEKV